MLIDERSDAQQHAQHKKTPQNTAAVAASNRKVQGGGSCSDSGFPVMPGMHAVTIEEPPSGYYRLKDMLASKHSRSFYLILNDLRFEDYG